MFTTYLFLASARKVLNRVYRLTLRPCLIALSNEQWCFTREERDSEAQSGVAGEDWVGILRVPVSGSTVELALVMKT